MPTLGAPDIRVSLGLGYTLLAGVVLALPFLVGLVVETPLYLLADRLGRRRLVVGGFAVAGIAAFAAALAPGGLWLSLALSVSFTAAGCAQGLVEAAQMDADPERREVWMTRYTLAGALGDLGAPGLVALVAAAGAGWRTGFVVVGCATLTLAVLGAWMPAERFTAAPDDEAGNDEEEERTLVENLRLIWRTPRLLFWTVGVHLCDLLDEILVVLAALFLREVRGADLTTAAVALALLPAGSTIGLVLTERLLPRLGARLILLASAPACVAAILVFGLVPSLPVSVGAAFFVGLFGAPFWPLAKSQAYAALPEASTVVNAAESLLSPIGVALPLVVFGAAELFGLEVAVILLVAQPALVGLLALTSRRAHRASPVDPL